MRHIEDTLKEEIFHRRLQSLQQYGWQSKTPTRKIAQKLKLVKTEVAGFGNLPSLKKTFRKKRIQFTHGILFKPNLIYYEIGFSRKKS